MTENINPEVDGGGGSIVARLERHRCAPPVSVVDGEPLEDEGAVWRCGHCDRLRIARQDRWDVLGPWERLRVWWGFVTADRAADGRVNDSLEEARASARALGPDGYPTAAGRPPTGTWPPGWAPGDPEVDGGEVEPPGVSAIDNQRDWSSVLDIRNDNRRKP